MTDRLRLNVELTEKQHEFTDSLPHGYKKAVIGSVLNLAIDLIDRHGKLGLSALLAEAVHLEIDKEKDE